MMKKKKNLKKFFGKNHKGWRGTTPSGQTLAPRQLWSKKTQR